MNVKANISKSTLLATAIFWLIIFTEDFEMDLLIFVLLSIIPICICVSIVILVSICPIIKFHKKEGENYNSVVKRCFPYQIIIVFTVCLYGVISSINDIHFMSFFITAFITTAQSWVWFAKEK